MKMKIVVWTLVILFILSYSLSKVWDIKETTNQIVIIPITGTITTELTSSLMQQKETSSTAILNYLDLAQRNPNIKGVLLEINSPGGTVVASKEIADKVKQMNKPVVSYIREIGTSGAYWIASSSNVIVADPLSITGSIGVIGSYLEFSELLEKYGVTYQRLVSGSYKDTGSPFKELTEEEKKILQSKIDLIHLRFVTDVSKNRNLPIEKVKELSTGMFYLGAEAKYYGLIDELGNEETAINILKEKAGIKEAKLVRYQQRRTLLDIFSQLYSSSFYYFGQGFSSNLIQQNKIQLTT